MNARKLLVGGMVLVLWAGMWFAYRGRTERQRHIGAGVCVVLMGLIVVTVVTS